MVMREATEISERRACQLVGLSRTVLHYETKAQPENEQLKAGPAELAGERRRFGYRRLHALVRRGVQAHHKRICRLYSDAGLSVRRRKRRHGVAVERQTLERPAGPNQVWSMDFVSDALANGRRIKVLTIVDDFSKEAIDLAGRLRHFRTLRDPCSRSGSSLSWLPQGYSNRPGAGIYR